MSEAIRQKSEVVKLPTVCAGAGMQHGDCGCTFAAAISRHCSRRTLIASLALVLLVGLGLAQVRSGDLTPQASGSKYYIWGQVHSPGAYSFLAAPDLFELISAAGGPTDDANLTRVILIRAVNQTRTRINLQAALNKGGLVRLSPGDVVMVPSSAWYRFRTGLTVVSSVVTLATLVITILNWMDI